MKWTLFVSLLILAPTGAHAQVTAPRTPPAPSPSTRPSTTDADLVRRRGSMVGYIDDPVIGTKLRLRFESAMENRTPDRAEFFYAKCGCYRDLSPSSPNYDASAPGPRPGAANDVNYQQLLVFGEFALANRVSLYGELPTRWLQPQSFIPGTGGSFPNHTGIGDVKAGVKLGAVANARNAVTVQAQWFYPTGSSENGLGTNHASLQSSLLTYHQLSDRLILETEIGEWHPFGGSAGLPTSSSDGFAGDVFFYGAGPSFQIYQSSTTRIAPVVEVVGWHIISGAQTAATSDASGINIVNLKLGGRIAWKSQHSVYAGYGHALTSESWYDDIVRIEYRFAF